MALTVVSPSVIGPVTGTGSVVLSTSPALVTPALGTPTSGNLANCTFPTLNQNTTGSAATVTTVTQANIAAAVNPSTSGNVLTSNGTAWTSTAPAVVYAGFTTKIFTESTTFTLPTGITQARITVVGGGGGGWSSIAGGGAGGYGGLCIAHCTNISGTLTITIGLGGAGTSANPGTGGNGGTSSIIGSGVSLSSTGGTGTYNASVNGTGTVTTGTPLLTNTFASNNPSPINVRPTQVISQPAVIWSPTLDNSAGARGLAGGGVSNTPSKGGVSGVVILEY